MRPPKPFDAWPQAADTHEWHAHSSAGQCLYWEHHMNRPGRRQVWPFYVDSAGFGGCWGFETVAHAEQFIRSLHWSDVLSDGHVRPFSLGATVRAHRPSRSVFLDAMIVLSFAASSSA